MIPILSDEQIKVIFLVFYEKQYGQEAAKMLYDQLPDCNYAKAIAQAQLRRVVEWGEEICPHASYRNSSNVILHEKKWYCKKCWQELKKLAEG